MVTTGSFMAHLEIVPGRSMGGISPGTDVGGLPAGAQHDGKSGQSDGVHFTIAAGKVDEVWIEDLRTLRQDGAVVAGRFLPKHSSLDDIKSTLGPCQKTESVKGGVFFRCDNGIVLGCDFDEQGTFIQIRLR